MPVNPTPDLRAHEARAQDNDEINLLDLLVVVADNLRLLVLAPLAIGIVALGISFLIPPTFTAKTRFLPPQQQQSGAAAMLQGLAPWAVWPVLPQVSKTPTTSLSRFWRVQRFRMP